MKPFRWKSSLPPSVPLYTPLTPVTWSLSLEQPCDHFSKNIADGSFGDGKSGRGRGAEGGVVSIGEAREAAGGTSGG